MLQKAFKEVTLWRSTLTSEIFPPPKKKKGWFAAS